MDSGAQTWAWRSSEAPDPRGVALLGVDLQVSEADKQGNVRVVLTASVLAPAGTSVDAVVLQAVLRDGQGEPLAMLEGSAENWQPGELRDVVCTAQGPSLGRAVHEVEAYVQEVRFEYVPVAVEQQLGTPDADGSREVTLFLRFDNPGPAATLASAELLWELADGSPVASAAVPLQMLASGPQVHQETARVSLPRTATHARPKGQLMLGFATSSGPHILGEDYPELADEGPRGALRGDGTVDPAETPQGGAPLRKKIPKQPSRPKMLAPSDLRHLAAQQAEAQAETPSETPAVDPRGAGRLARVSEPATPPTPAPVQGLDPRGAGRLSRDGVQPVPGRTSLRDLVQTDQLDVALERVDAEGLAGGDRQDVSELLDASEEAWVAAGCALAVRGGWGGVSTRLRRLLTHESPVVRAAVATALGELGGRSVVPSLRRCLDDEHAAVADAAQAAIDQLMHGA